MRRQLLYFDTEVKIGSWCMTVYQLQLPVFVLIKGKWCQVESQPSLLAGQDGLCEEVQQSPKPLPVPFTVYHSLRHPLPPSPRRPSVARIAPPVMCVSQRGFSLHSMQNCQDEENLQQFFLESTGFCLQRGCHSCVIASAQMYLVICFQAVLPGWYLGKSTPGFSAASVRWTSPKGPDHHQISHPIRKHLLVQTGVSLS